MSSAMASGGSILIGYLLGSISWSYVIVRLLRGVDIRTVGSGNAGATNVLRVAGKVPALCALLLDICKGLFAILIARALEAPIPVVGVVGIAAVLGHMYPVFFGFRGGKGVATAAGTLGTLAPLATLISALAFVLIVAWKRYVSLGSISVAVLCPFVVLALGASGRSADPDWPWIAGAAAGIGALIVWKHRSNLKRLLAGTESKLGEASRV